MMVSLFLLSPLAWPGSALAKAPSGDSPHWNSFVVGSVDDLPDGATKDFLIDSHFNNPFADKIKGKLQTMGPFSPFANKVFWIPTIDVPLEEDNWRFLSSTENIPEEVRKLTLYEKDGRHYVRMFVHPFTTENPAFARIARENGGFKYEFQGSVTASVRSMIAWRVREPKNEANAGKLQFPKDRSQFIWPKVSIHKTDINGSRLNPAKKMVRAHGVTETMDTIPDALRRKAGFDFSGEWMVGVPDGTDAGFAVREVLSEYTTRDGARAEPAFSILSPRRMSEILKGQKDPDQFVRDRLMKPLARAVAYLLMEEGMIGEYHTQNVSFVVDESGLPTGKVLLHDADAFRTSLVLRTLNQKNTQAVRSLETPFFFMKDATFGQAGGFHTQGFNLNGLVWDMMASPEDPTTLVASVLRACKKIPELRLTCSGPQIRDAFLSTLADELSPYLGRAVAANELSYGGLDAGTVGLTKIFKERLARVAGESPLLKLEPDPKIQKLLFKEYVRLSEKGYSKTMGSKISLENSIFLLNPEEEKSSSRG